MKLIEVVMVSVCSIMLFPSMSGCLFSVLLTIDCAQKLERQTGCNQFIAESFQNARTDESLSVWKRTCIVLYHPNEIEYEINERCDGNGKKMTIYRGWWTTGCGVIRISRITEE